MGWSDETMIITDVLDEGVVVDVDHSITLI